ncbi:GTPase [Pseudomonas indica]|uniref:GTPase n=1 Tax=Pseudomonas indica TaxID=137658 RepID=UPI000BAB7056|nr:GTPase [Pseudomonas indica]PAU63663.1 GTPase [Pseudomonas indica]
MDHALIRAQMPTIVAGHVPRNARSFKFRIYDEKPPVPSALGILIDPVPFQGTVIGKTEIAIVIKVGRTQFAALDRALMSQEPADGAKVQVTPYARRHFDGQRVDTPTQHEERWANGKAYTVQSLVLGGTTTRIPLPAPRCPELAELIEQLESLPAPDGFRRIAHLLVDAGARDFTCVDPLPKDILRTPPAIGFTVDTAKFRGQVTVLYDRGLDVYTIELRRDGALVERVDEVYFDDLGSVLERLIDDGRWRQIRVDVLSQPARTRQKEVQ